MKETKLEIEKLSSLIEQATSLVDRINELKQRHDKIPVIKDAIYNNKELCSILSVDDRLIKKYRDNGLLSFHRVGDKYWYRGSDIIMFLNRNRYEMFA